jgi:hypothetical protein
MSTSTPEIEPGSGVRTSHGEDRAGAAQALAGEDLEKHYYPDQHHDDRECDRDGVMFRPPRSHPDLDCPGIVPSPKKTMAGAASAPVNKNSEDRKLSAAGPLAPIGGGKETGLWFGTIGVPFLLARLKSYQQTSSTGWPRSAVDGTSADPLSSPPIAVATDDSWPRL